MHEAMVRWRFEHHQTALEISTLAGCSERTVYEILRLHRDYGQVTNPFARTRGRPRILNNGDIEYIHALLQANPMLYLDELQEQLFAAQDKDISLATLSRAIWRLAMTHKRVSKTAAERNELLRATWQAMYGNIPAEYFVWLDESSVDNKTNQRNHGWADLGLVMYQAWLGLKARAWAWLWWAWAFKIVSQARIEGLPKPRAWLGLKHRLVYHIWLLLQKALKCVAE
jgi:transposase